MDIDALITAVYKRRPIWDKRSKLHSNRNVVDRYWREIAEEMKEDEQKLRKKWKYIRDQFSVELGKFPPPRSGDAANDTPTSKWPYFKVLLFLKDTVTPRNLKGNLPKVKGSISTGSCIESQPETEELIQTPLELENATSYYNEDEILEIIPPELNVAASSIIQKSDQESIDLRSTPQSSSRRKRGPTEAFNESLLDIEKRKVAYLESKSKRSNEKEDEHLLFFRSLLPHVKRIPESRILSFRCRVQELVEQFSYPTNLFQSVPPVPPSTPGASHSNSSISSLHYSDSNQLIDTVAGQSRSHLHEIFPDNDY